MISRFGNMLGISILGRMDAEKPNFTRLDLYLAQSYPQRSRREWKELCREGRVSSGGQVLGASEAWPRIGKILSLRDAQGHWHDLPAPQTSSNDASEPPALLAARAFWAERLQAVHPDQEQARALVLGHVQGFWIFNKPAGMPSHPMTLDDPAPCLLDLAGALCPSCLECGDTPREGGLIHRLDTDTSGLLLVADSVRAWQKGVAAFRRSGPSSDSGGLDMHQEGSRGEGVAKTYVALVLGMAPDRVEAAFPVAHHQKDERRMVALGAPHDQEPHRGQPREARSLITCLGRTKLAGGRTLSLVEVELLHGQRHQVRVHCAGLGLPLWGDGLYGGCQALLALELPWGGSTQAFAADHHALHAWKLDFLGGLTAPLPPRMARVLAALGWDHVLQAK